MGEPRQKSAEQAPKVPQNLIDELHEANRELHEKRKQMEGTHDDYDADLEHREGTLDQIRSADRHVDEVKKKIDQAMQPAETSTAPEKSAPPDSQSHP